MKKRIISIIFTIALIFVFGAPIISDAVDIICLNGLYECSTCNHVFTANELSVINDGTTDDPYYTSDIKRTATNRGLGQ
ncbi:MAG: hypothetical protein VB118_04620 [Oscillospiraceae bacterium]|nr:hypothetical protein [Oscillospiraceae bacterium]